MRRVLKALLWLFLTLLALVIAGMFFIMRSEYALHWALRQAVSLTDGQFSFERARGSLSGPVRIRGLGYRTDTGEVRIETLGFDWSPSKLFSGRVSVSYLEADRASVRLLPGAPKEETEKKEQAFPGFEIPVPIELNGFRVGELVVEAPDAEPIVVKNIGLDARLHRDKLRVSAFSADTLWADLKAEGRMSTVAGFPFELELTWDSRLAGPERPIQGEGTVSGSLEQIDGVLHLSTPVKTDLTMRVTDPMGNLSWQATVTADRQKLAGLGVPDIIASLETKGSGTLEQWGFESSAAVSIADQGTFQLALKARGDRKEARVLDLSVNEAQTGAQVRGQGRWSFASSSPIDASLRWTKLRWPLQGEEAVGSPSGQVRVQGSPTKYTLDGRVQVTAPGFPEMNWTYAGNGSNEEFTLSELRGAVLNGVVKAEGFVRWSEPRPRWNAQLSAKDLSPKVVWPEIEGLFALAARAGGSPENGQWVTDVHLDSLSGQVADFPLSVKGEARLLGSAQGRLSLSAQNIGDIKGEWRTRGEEIDARLDLQVADLAPLGKLYTEVDQVKGKLRGDVKVSGPLAEPRVNADVVLSEAMVGIPRLGLSLKKMKLQMRLEDSQRLMISGAVASGPGSIRIEGDGAVQGADQWKATVRLKGERFQVVRLPNAQALVSPDLSAEVVPEELKLQGRLHIPEATIQLPEFEEGAIAPSSDVVVVGGPEQPQRKPPMRVAVRVMVSMGEQVRLHGYGFDGRLAGQLTIIDTPGKPALGQGELSVPEGRYKGYGQDLSVEQGQFLFAASPLDNPGLNIRAVRTVGSIKAGIIVSGRLKTPELRLYSDPVMSDAETLAYLVTGRPLSKASGQEGQSFAAAAAALKLVGGSVGLEGVEIESQGATETDPAALALGTYLSPRLYIRYAIALGAVANTFQLRYQLTDRWAVETETGREAGVDFTYTLEH